MNQTDDNLPKSLFATIPEYEQIINELSKGSLKANFSHRKSKLCYSLNDILFDENNDELSYFILFMDSKQASNYVKFLLDLNNFEQTFTSKNKIKKCEFCEANPYIPNNNCQCFKNFSINVAQDALSIYTKYISKEARYSIDLSENLIKSTISNICPENGESTIDANCFKSSKDHIYKHLLNNYYDKYLTSEYHCKYLLNILEDQNLELCDFLYDEIAIVYFLEYIEKENVRDLLKFWMQVENFSRNLLLNKCAIKDKQVKRSTIDAIFKQSQNDAMIIYDNYISLQAKHSLGFDSLVRCQVESNICQLVDLDKVEDFEYLLNSYSNCFYVPMLIIFNILDKVYYKRFLSSYLYKNYMNEIIVNSNITKSDKIEKKDTKITKRNEDEDKDKKKTSFFFDDPLWPRSTESSNMQLGKIDSTGRFIRNFKMKPDESNDMLNKLSDDYDDAWNLFNTSNTQTVLKDTSTSSIAENINSNVNNSNNNNSKKMKSKFEKFIDFIPLNGLNFASNSKSIEEEREMAERVAQMLVNDVIRQNQLI